MRGTRHRIGAALALAACAALVASCRPAAPRPTTGIRPDTSVARGSMLYASYCAGCHGADGRGDGPVARTLHVTPTDLRTPRLFAGVSDAEITARVLHGEPLRTAPHGSAFATERQVATIEEYVLALDGRRWERVRAGRLVYESNCAACHGAYGSGEGVLGSLLARAPADLQLASARYTDAAFAAVIRNGTGAMPPMGDLIGPDETRALIVYVRLLSPGYRLYDTYCASCHGDDGRGVHPEDTLPPALVGPPLQRARLAAMRPDARRAQVLHMFERERGVMPHFRSTLDAEQIADVVAFLRTRQR
ncbi:MAG: c-type cytochrome [Deltaproteobacteria bacterium]|nr:c-type cytochrome [Deltaproteobacteria bacterium]